MSDFYDPIRYWNSFADVCDYAGHDFEDAGGGLLICMVCGAEEWDDDYSESDYLLRYPY